MDSNPLVEIVQDESLKVIIRTFCELARDKVKNIYSSLKDDDSIDIENPNEVEEKALRQILSDPQNKKCEYILHFLRTVKEEKIGNDTAYSLLQSIDNMSWRQFCILTCLYKRNMNQLQIEPSFSGQVSLQVNTIVNDVENLMSNGYIDRSDDFIDYARHSPDDLHLTPLGLDLISLLKLNTIPDDESDKPFLPWGITRTKRE